MKPIYVITAYRYGLRDASSYVVGAHLNILPAIKAARLHHDCRAGKYGIEISEIAGEPDDFGEQKCRQLLYIESNYYGICGQTWPAGTAADAKKPTWVIEPQPRVKIK